MMRFQDVSGLSGEAERHRLGVLAEELQFDDPINIQFTSGTTGFPKGATLTHHNILNNGFFLGKAMKFTERDRVCIPVPLYHCCGMVIGNLGRLTHGAAMVYPSEGFDPLATLETIEAERCTAVYSVPTMFIAQMDHPDGGRAIDARLPGDARLLGRRGENARGDRRGRVDAHRRPRDDRQRGLLQYCRPHQGHGYPRRRERLSARDRRISIPPPKDQGRVGDRRAGSALWRGALRLGPPARRRDRHSGGDPRLLPGQIAHYKVPRYVKFVDGFPMTITGKIQKFLMRQQMIEELRLSLQETA